MHRPCYDRIELKEVVDVISGYAFPGYEMGSSGSPIIKIKNIIPPMVDTTDVDRISEEFIASIPKLEKFMLKHKDILVAMTGATVGKIGRFPKVNEIFYLNQRVARIDLRNPVQADIDYIYCVLSQAQYTDQIFSLADGSAQANVSASQIGNITIPLPPLPEQRRIAHILGTLDDKIENNRKTAKTLEAMAQAIFKSWFVDFDPVRAKIAGEPRESICQRLKLTPEILDLFPDRLVDSELGEIPEGWSVKQLADFCTTQYGYTTSATDDTAGPKLLRVTDINKNPWIDWRTVPHCSADQSSTHPYKLNEGDIVVARMADPGKSAIIEDNTNAIFASYLVRLKAKQENLRYFIYGFLKSELYAVFIEATKGGSVQFNMNAKVIVSASMTAPNNAILFFYQDTVAQIRKNLALNISQVGALTEVRRTLLPKLISGEIRVPEVEHLVKAVMDN